MVALRSIKKGNYFAFKSALWFDDIDIWVRCDFNRKLRLYRVVNYANKSVRFVGGDTIVMAI